MYRLAYIVAFEIYCVLKSIINGVRAINMTFGALTVIPSRKMNCTLIISSVKVAILWFDNMFPLNMMLGLGFRVIEC